ncbi:MAG: Gfo/Idh/MocA family oxidoreductase [Bryobacteraceae bacterium]|nr:Gfo/Idh/MocA family oxidoreductase [Bryobacteraceae bacterium]
MSSDRREFVKAAGMAAAATSFFPGRVLGANDRMNAAFIGMGKMGRSNLAIASRQENFQVVAVCDIFERNLNWAAEAARKKFPEVKAVKDFREILADKSIDIVCISTPDHWHPYMTVEACKAGKDVYVEKPICVTIDEGTKMVQAARKYKRVVQAGTMQRSGDHFQAAVKLVKDGEIGQVTRVQTWNVGLSPVIGQGAPADSEPPAGLDWDMWLGPAPKRAFNENRFGVDPEDKNFSSFRWFWDYAGGMMTDWGIHLLDIVQMAFNETMPKSVSTFGEKFRLKDNRETPDTILASYEYPEFIATYENRYGNANTLTGHGYGITFHGDKGTLFVDRAQYQLTPEGRGATTVTVKSGNNSNSAHWANFLDCVKTRKNPIADIEVCQRSTTTCLLANVSLRSKLRLDWDEAKWTTRQSEARKFLSREERKPWKLVV